MQRGVIYGLLAGALWGMVFLTPLLLPDFSPWALSAGRYVAYGLVSLVLALPGWRGLMQRLTWRDARALALFAVTGNLAYYLFLALGVQHVGIAPTSLIIGVLPLTITLIGARDHGAAPLCRLALPLALIAGGIVCINLDVFGVGVGNGAAAAGAAANLADGARMGHVAQATHIAPAAGWLGRGVGLVCAALALASWTWFAVSNARYLQRHPHFFGNEWSLLYGIASGLLGLLVGAVAWWVPHGVADAVVSPERWRTFWALNMLLAVAASWLGNGLWNNASRLLPLTLTGQLIVFETLFALLYGFIYAQRWPRPLEAAAIALLVGGVWRAVRVHAPQAPEPGGTRSA